MFRMGIIEECLENREILKIFEKYFISQRIEHVLEDEYPTWHTNEYHIPEEAIWELLDTLKEQIKTTLQNFGIAISKIKATVGPTVTLYEIIPAPGIKIARIKSLEEDIAMSLKALRIRIIAPIPGKGTVGIEVPNKTRSTVTLREIISSEFFMTESDIFKTYKNLYYKNIKEEDTFDLVYCSGTKVKEVTNIPEIPAIISTVMQKNIPFKNLFIYFHLFLSISAHSNFIHTVIPCLNWVH